MIWRATLARTIVRVRGAWVCVSHCEMTTHAHLIVAVADDSLSTGMHMLDGEYTRAFNRRHGRHGPLQRRRFGAVRIETATHLLRGFRYVARNPAEAGLCASPLDWPDSSYRAALRLFVELPSAAPAPDAVAALAEA